ncbi:hypothetical protein ACVWXO_002168 [Bradyrhizobium sp. LM2.7]
MPGLVPGVHVLRAAWPRVDGRDKPGHDAVRPWRPNSKVICDRPAPSSEAGEGTAQRDGLPARAFHSARHHPKAALRFPLGICYCSLRQAQIEAGNAHG